MTAAIYSGRSTQDHTGRGLTGAMAKADMVGHPTRSNRSRRGKGVRKTGNVQVDKGHHDSEGFSEGL